MNNIQAVTKMEEPELLNEVPPILKRLAKTVAYAFYEPELIVTLSLLIKYPCIDEDSLIERLQFDKRQMRQTLSKLKNDKLIKQRVVKEKVPETGNFNIFNFYFINYKLFVNVVKYKLDHVRRKLETEEQQIRNRPSFQCQNCEKHFSDLEIDRLVDMETGELKCSFCHGMVEEDPMQLNSLGTGSSLGKFNEQMETIFNLLKECENINLAPEVLEPTPSTVGLKSVGPRAPSNKAPQWSTGQSVDLYDQRIQINVGDEVEQNKAVPKTQDLPAWITHSTVFEEQAEQAKMANSSGETKNNPHADESNQTSKDIMSDLLAHESEKKKPRLDLTSNEKVETGSRSSVSPETSKLSLSTTGVTEVADMGDSDDEDDDDDDDDDDSEVKVKVGDEMISFSDITDDIIAKMTSEEHDAYLEVYNEMAADGY